MTEQPPTPPENPTSAPTPGGPDGPPTETLTAEQPAGRNTKRLVIGGVAAVAVLAVAGGAFAAFQNLDGGGAQPHDVLPDSVIAYARVDVDPSASQKIALLKLIRKFPDAAESIGITSPNQDVRKLIFDRLLDEGGCDLSYDADIKPWIGSRAGMGLEKDGKTGVFALQVSDEDKARKGLDELFACGGDEKPGVTFLDGYAVVAETQSIADKAVKEAKDTPLADKKSFVEDFEDLGDQGVASVWADVEGALDIPGAMESLDQDFAEGFGPGSDQFGEFAKAFKDLRSGAATLRASSDAFEVVGIVHNDGKPKDLEALPIGQLPASTVAAISSAGGGDAVGEQWDAFVKSMEASGEASEADIQAFEDQTGFALPEDLQTLFGDTFTVAMGSENLEKLPTFSGPDDIGQLDIGLLMKSDQTKATDLAERIVSLAAQAGLSLKSSKAEDGAVIATNEKAADDLSKEGSLGDSASFKQVVPDVEDATSAMYVDIAKILDALSAANPPAEVAEQIDQAKVLSAFGFSTSHPSDHVDKLSVKLAFAK